VAFEKCSYAGSITAETLTRGFLQLVSSTSNMTSSSNNFYVTLFSNAL
jgi:hypothetical protein